MTPKENIFCFLKEGLLPVKDDIIAYFALKHLPPIWAEAFHQHIEDVYSFFCET